MNLPCQAVLPLQWNQHRYSSLVVEVFFSKLHNKLFFFKPYSHHRVNGDNNTGDEIAIQGKKYQQAPNKQQGSEIKRVPCICMNSRSDECWLILRGLKNSNTRYEAEIGSCA